VDDYIESVALVLYPNPASNELTLVSVDVIESVSIINMSGAQVHSTTGIKSREYMITLDGINPGVYIIEVRTVDHQSHFNRFVKR
jgi:hypothetical protein